MSDAYNALGAAPADSPLPTTITPDMAQALQSYQGGPGGNLLARAGHAIFDEPLAALKGQMTDSEAQDFAVRTALGAIGPMGLGKGAGIAMGLMGAAKKAAPKVAADIAENIAGRESAHFPLDDIEKALGGWDEGAQMPAHGSDWAAVGPSSTLPKASPKINSQAWLDNTANSAADYLHSIGKATPKDTNSLNTQALINWAHNNGHPATQGLELSPKGWIRSEPSLEPEDIDSALAANPGASIFDLAGVSRPTPKIMPADEIGMTAAAMTETLPRGATWQLPDAAKAQGYNVAVHHGTRTPTIFDQFKLPDDEIGVHFGSPRAAQEIQGSSLNPQDAPRVYPAAIVAQNPVRLPDLGTWEPWKVARSLVTNAGFNQDELKPVLGTEQDITRTGGYAPYSVKSTEQQAADLRQYLASKGHDSIVYKNSVEDAGHDSYILFRESPSAPGHVYGARLPWADFDPSKFTSASIKAGIPLGAATGAYMSDQGGKLHPLEDASSSPHAQAAFPEDNQL